MISYTDNKIDSYIIAILFTLYATIMSYVLFFYNIPEIQFFSKVDVIGFLAISILILTLFIILRNIKNFAFLLVFILLSFPSNINNFFPSVLFSASADMKDIYYPLITHIDVLLILGLFKFYKKNKNNNSQKTSSLPYIILSGFLIALIGSLIINIFRSENGGDILLMLSHSYPIRYTLLLLLLIKSTDILEYKSEILFGVIIAILFLLVESIIYTNYFKTARLVSGSLKVNTFANILTAVNCACLFLVIRGKISKTYLVFVLVTFTAVYFTTTRSALYLFIAYVLIEVYLYAVKLLKQKRRFHFMFVIVIVFLFTGLMVVFNTNERQSLKNLKIEKIELKENTLNRIIVLEKNSFTESLILRLNHFQTSLNMIKERPCFGIGPGMWNKHKATYDSKELKVMDAHNDLLAAMSQFGILQGIIFCFILYLTPLYFIVRKNKAQESLIKYLYIINLVMLFAGFTNAGLFKHQIFGFLMLIVIIFAVEYNNNQDSNISYENSNTRNKRNP